MNQCVVLFDCFGVLLTDPLATTVEQLELSDEARQQVTEIMAAANHGFLSIEESRRAMADAAAVSLDRWNDLILTNEARNQPLFAYIASLRAAGHKTGILSNVGAGGIYRRFTAETLERYFDDVLESGSVGLAKPDLRIYRLAAQRIGIATERCIFIDDNASFCEAARQTGMLAVWYQSLQQAIDDTNACIDRLVANPN